MRLPITPMTTSQKLWLGFGTLTCVLVLSVAMMVGLLRSTSSQMHEMANVARLRWEIAQQLKIHVIGYALAVRASLQTDDTGFANRADVEAADVERNLAEYERLAATERQAQARGAFCGAGRPTRTLARSCSAPRSALDRTDSDRLAELRVGLETFLDDELQPNAVESFNADKEAAFQDLRTSLILAGWGCLWWACWLHWPPAASSAAESSEPKSN